MCEKATFNTKYKAHNKLRVISKIGKRMRVYQCPKCFKYHLTSKMNTLKI